VLNLTELPAEARDLALDRFRLLEPHLKGGVSLRLVAVDAGIPFRTAQRWVSHYRAFGLAALARKSRDDRGARRVVSSKLLALIEGLALERPPLSITSIHRQVRAFAGVDEIPAGPRG
jgi:putative transposase